MFNNCSHYDGLHNHSIINSEDIKIIERNIDKMSCGDISKGIRHRIGSVSERAKVFKLILKDYVIAVKIMNPDHIRENEFEISRNVSHEYPKYFLRTFNRKYCEVEYNGVNRETQLLFMEIAIGDLYQVITQGVDQRSLENYISDVFNAVAFLSHLGYKHNDLTVKNVFVVCTGKTTRAVLGDFGETIPVGSIVSGLNDILKFLISLKSYLGDEHQDYKHLIEYYTRNTLGPYIQELEEKSFNMVDRAEEVVYNALDMWLDLIKDKMEY